MGDMHEGYEVGWEALDPKPNDSERSNDGAMAGANVWPSELPEFREAILKY
jgi:isopenicillin N synthase-like dioxygenase